MRSFLLATATIAPLVLSAQEVSWMESWPVNYALNPGYPQQVLTGGGGTLLSTRQVIGAFPYGQDLFGEVALERLEPSTGNVLWTCMLSDSVVVDAGAVDADGNIYVAGRYMGALNNCDGSVLGNTSNAQWNVDLFLMSYSPDGLLRWSRDLSTDHPDAGHVASLAVDPDGKLWYALAEFGLGRIIRVDDMGGDAAERVIDGVTQLGTIDFDPWGGLYVSGASDENGFAFGGQSYQFDPGTGYQMFVLRYTAAGTAGFAQFARDVTFQRPTVMADEAGNAYLAGALLDSTAWDGLVLNGPEWVYDTFIAKLDSTGHFLWARESDPLGGPIVGDMQRCDGPCIAVDGAGNVYLMGSVRGTVDWSNGVVSGNAAIPQDAVTIVKFAPDGQAQWAANSQPSNNGSFPKTLTSDASGTIHFAVHTSGAFTFAPITVNDDGGQDAVVGELNMLSTGIDHPVRSSDVLAAWPSPASTTLNVQWKGTTATSADVVNSAGQHVRTFRLIPGLNTIGLEGMSSGLYLLRTTDGTATRVLKQ